jgi:type I restriction enzyme S subunit
MREMKDSGIEWIGKIPESWSMHPVGFYFDERKNKNYDLRERNLLSLSYGRIIRKDINTNGGLLPASFNSYNIVRINDIIIRPTDLQNDKKSLRTGLVNEQKGIITSAYLALKPKKNVNSRYFHYLLHSYDVIKVFYNMGNGVRQGLNFSEFSKLMLVAPPIQVQQKISDFLDKKCSEIDSLSTDIQTQIDTLEEYKKSIITEAVTKGINPNVEMKDSGVQWIGLCPSKWNIVKLKYNSSLKGRIGWQGLRSSEFIDEGPFLITGTDFSNGLINWESCAHISDSRFNQDLNIHIHEGDMLITKDGTIGKVAIAKNCPQKVSLNSGVFIIRNNRTIKYHNKFMYYVLISNEFHFWFYLSHAGNSTIKHLNQEKFYEFKFAFPEINEQEKISQFLDNKCSEIHKIILEKQKQLENLAEYKKSLIYEYVTGKKEIA